MKNLIKARSLRQKIANRGITCLTHPNTYVRLDAVCKALEGEKLVDIVDKWDVNMAAVIRWRDWYLKNESIKYFLDKENRPVIYSRRDKSNDKRYAKELRKELKSLDKERFPNNYIRLNAVCEVLEGKESQKVAKKWNIVSPQSITKWINWYLEDGSIENFEDIEGIKVNNRDTSNDQIYADSLRQELTNLNSALYPNTYRRLSAVLKTLEGSKLQEAADEFLINHTTPIIKWRNWYLDNMSIEKIKDIEKYNINQSKRDTSNDNIYKQLIDAELLILDLINYPNTYRRLEAIRELFKGSTFKDAAKNTTSMIQTAFLIG